MRKLSVEEQVKIGKVYGVWTVEAVSFLLGVSQFTVYRWIKQGKIDALKLGNGYLVTTDGLLKFFEDDYHLVYQRRYSRRLKRYAGSV